MSLFPEDPQAVTVLADALADPAVVLEALAPLGTGDVFCAAAPEDEDEDEWAAYLDADGDEDADGADGSASAAGGGSGGGDGSGLGSGGRASYPYYSATFSDTVATFVVEVERADRRSPRTAYVVRVAEAGPGASRLRYRLAKAVIAATGGTAVDAQGAPVPLSAPAQDPFGALW